MKKADFVKEIESIYGTQQSKMINGYRFIDKEEIIHTGWLSDIELKRCEKWIQVEIFDKETNEWCEDERFYYIGYKIKPCCAKTLANKMWNEYENYGWQGAYGV